jgi:segregation and condensation protein B
MIAVLEGLLFISGDEGIELETIKNILEITDEELTKLINNLIDNYSSNERGLNVELFGKKIKLTTKPEHKKYYEKLVTEEANSLLSNAALETLAIIAYNGPVTRIEIDEIRGINSSHLIRKLLLKNLIKDVGRSDKPGRPILYNVTEDFLDYFGLNSIEDLPEIEKIEIDDTEENLFESKYKELN